MPVASGHEITVDLPFLWKTFKLFHQTRCLAQGSNDIFPNSVHDSKDPFPTPPVARACFCWLSDPPAARRWHRPEGAEHNTVPARTAKTPWPRLECLKEARLKKKKIAGKKFSVFVVVGFIYLLAALMWHICIYTLIYIYIFKAISCIKTAV